MDNYFDVSKKHKICAANSNEFAVSTMHPRRKLLEHDFIYMLDGEWTIGQGDEEFHIQKDDVLLLAAKHIHYGIRACAEKTRTMYIHALYNEGDCAGCDGDNETIMIKSLVNAKGNPNVKRCFEKVIYAKACERDIEASAWFDVLLCELHNCMNENPANGLAENIRRMIVSSGKMVKNTEIAKTFNISVKTAETLFKKEFGCTMHQYLVGTKLERARDCLSHFPDMKLYEIATNLGFYDEFHLSRNFKKAFGISPREYRKRIER